MDSLASFTSQCIAKADSQDLGSFLLSFGQYSPPTSPSRIKNKVHKDTIANKDRVVTARTEGAMLCPSDLTAKESLVGEEDVWMCDMCQHLNSGGRGACGLCWRERTIFDVIDYEEDFSLDTDTRSQNSNMLISCVMEDQGATSSRPPLNTFNPAERNALSVSIASSMPLKCDVKAAFGGSPKCEGGNMSSAMDICHMENLPPGASPPNCCEVNSISSETETLRGCRASSISLDSSISEEEDDSYLLSYVGPMTCPHSQCNTILEDYNAFQLHLQQHKWGPHKAVINENGETSFVCGYEGCGKLLEDKKLLRKHMLSHREKVFACHYQNCDRKFYERAKLKRHFLVHTGEKPFVCPFESCGKRFGYNANLKTHLRTHTGSRPFACTVPNCRRRFAQASNRNSHVLTHLKAGDDYEDTEEYEGEPVAETKKGRVAAVKKERVKRERRGERRLS